MRERLPTPTFPGGGTFLAYSPSMATHFKIPSGADSPATLSELTFDLGEAAIEYSTTLVVTGGTDSTLAEILPPSSGTAIGDWTFWTAPPDFDTPDPKRTQPIRDSAFCAKLEEDWGQLVPKLGLTLPESSFPKRSLFGSFRISGKDLKALGEEKK